jgi:alanine-synthesizing transaminase
MEAGGSCPVQVAYVDKWSTLAIAQGMSLLPPTQDLIVFSRRLPTDLTPNALSVKVSRLRREGRPILDLTLSNPTRAGFDYPTSLLAPLADPSGLLYDPHPLGMMAARQAVVADYERRGVVVAAERVVLTASSSDAYSLLFKLLVDPGDEVLVPRPSYPLFEHLARLDAVVNRPYDLWYDGAWSIDFDSLERAITARTRAILVVTPNNPTGSFVKRDEIDRLAQICRASGAAIISDEVFADYELEPGETGAVSCLLDRRDVLVFSLGGLSKSIGLPQVKLGWIGVGGPDELIDQALHRLEMVCDTYLSVSTPVQVAAAELFRRGAPVRAQIQARVIANYRRLTTLAASVPSCRVLRAEGGWYGVLHVPSLGTEEDLVLELLDRDGVLTHPGYFFDFPRETYLVVGLILPEDVFAEGISRLFRRFNYAVACHE